MRSGLAILVSQGMAGVGIKGGCLNMERLCCPLAIQDERPMAKWMRRVGGKELETEGNEVLRLCIIELSDRFSRFFSFSVFVASIDSGMLTGNCRMSR